MSPMPEQRPMLCYASAIPAPTPANCTWWRELLFAIGIAVMALLVILPFFDSPPSVLPRSHLHQLLKLHVFP